MSRLYELKKQWQDAEAELDRAYDTRQNVGEAKARAQAAFDRYDKARVRALRAAGVKERAR